MALTSVSARQRYPWNGKVDVDVAFEGPAGNAYRIELSATDRVGGTNLAVTTVWRNGAEGMVGNPVDVPAPGTHRLVWDAAADLPSGFVADRVVLSAKLLNPIWSFESIPAIDTSDVWAPETVYHDVQTVASYGEIENHTPVVRCLTDEWHLENTLGTDVVFSGASMGLRSDNYQTERRGVYHPIVLYTWSDSIVRTRFVTLDYETGVVAYDNAYPYNDNPKSYDARFFSLKEDDRIYSVVARAGYHAVVKSANTDISASFLYNRWSDNETGSAVCSYFPKGIPFTDASKTMVLADLDKDSHAGIFFCGVAGTDRKEAVFLGGGGPKVVTNSVYSCMKNPTGRYVVPMLDGTNYFTVGHGSGDTNNIQYLRLFVGHFAQRNARSFDLGRRYREDWPTGYDSWPQADKSARVHSWVREPSVAYSKGVAMPDGRRIFLGGAGRDADGKVRMWQDGTNVYGHANYPAGHPFESWARRDITCLLPNGKFCGVDEELGLVVVNPLTGEMYVASDDPVFKKGKMGCQLLPNGKVWIIPYDCEGREFEAGLALCGKLYEVDFGFTKSFSLSSLCSPYLKVAEGDPEPSGIKVGLDPNGGELPGIYAQYYKGANPKYGTLPTPALTGHTFRGWSTDGTAARVVAATASVPTLGILLKAAWQANTYTVKFNANGGSGSMSNQSFTYDVAKALTANAFTRTGYTFAGWATSATGAKAYNDKQSVSNLSSASGATVNLYAVWTANTYSVKFNANGGSGSMSNESFTYDVAKALTANAFTRTGYTFAGWATSATGAKAYNDKQSVSNLSSTSGATVNLYAVWTANTYSVKFNANGGSGSMSNESFTYDVAKALTANAFKRTGYMFAGWATSATGAKAYNDKQSVSNLSSASGATVNLYAVWTANTYSVKFNANTTGTTGSMSNESFSYGMAKALTANAFKKTGYTFAGWATSATGAKAYNDKQTVSNLTATANAVVDLYGLWTTNRYTVRYNKNATDATGTMANQGFPYDYEAGLRAIAFARTGYTFAGWATSATGAKVYDNKQKVKNLSATNGATVDLYAVWTPITYSVKFNANGGSGTMSNESFTYGTAKALTANAFKRTGYTFAGWATSASGAKVYNDKQSVSNLTATANGTVNLYAVWTANTYAVTLDRQSGTGGSASATATYGSAMPSITVPTRTGYAFGGYYTAANGGGTQYYTAAGASARNWDKTAATTLYAKWAANTYAVTLDRQSGTGGSASATATYGSAMPAITVPTRTGYAFGGYYTAANGGGTQYYTAAGASARNWDKTAATTLYAKWAANTYAVTLDRQSGTGGSTSATATYGSAMPSITVPTRTGYAFGGYYTAANGGGTQYYTAAGASARNWDKTAATTLYAKWTGNSYSVKFNKNASDATGTMSNESFTYGTAKALTANAFARAGYAFAGWATSASGAKVYNDKQSVNNLTATAGGTVDLYAVWTTPLYMVIDLSSGSSSSTYPVSYLASAPSGGWTDEYKTTKLVLRRIAAGTFTMGSPTGEIGRRYPNETQHKVTLSKAYYIGVFEVTQRQWELVMGNRPSYFSNASCYNTRPVEQISYNAIRGSSSGAGWPGSSNVDSTSFIGRVRARTGMSQFDLPTEAQWEYACRAGTTTAVSNGMNLNNEEYDSRIDSVCWHYKDYTLATTSSGTGTTGTNPVGVLGANPWGLYDMHGNVWEWCLDWHATDLGTSAVTDPKGASTGTQRVIRSGAWECASYNCRSARRGFEPPSRTKRSDSDSDGHFGFRLSCTP